MITLKVIERIHVLSIKSFYHLQLKMAYESSDVNCYQLIDHPAKHVIYEKMMDVSILQEVEDLRQYGAVQFDPENEYNFSVTITINEVEPCSALVFIYYQGDCYNMDLHEYNA